MIIFHEAYNGADGNMNGFNNVEKTDVAKQTGPVPGVAADTKATKGNAYTYGGTLPNGQNPKYQIRNFNNYSNVDVEDDSIYDL